METREFGYVNLARTETAVAVLTVSRAEKRNAQSPRLLYDLDAALTWAARDEQTRVILVQAEGPDFSAGHDLAAPHVLPCVPTATLEGDYSRASRIEAHL